MTTGQARDRPKRVTEALTMVTIAALAVAVVGSLLSLVELRPWTWGLAVERSLPALPGVIIFFGPINRRLVRWGFLPSADREQRSISWDKAVRRAALAGSLPAGEDPEDWRPHIRHHIVVLRVLVPTMVALFLAVSALTGVTAAATSHNDATVWALAAGVAMSGLFWAALGRGRLRATHALLDSLEPQDRDSQARQVPGRGWHSGSHG